MKSAMSVVCSLVELFITCLLDGIVLYLSLGHTPSKTKKDCKIIFNSKLTTDTFREFVFFILFFLELCYVIVFRDKECENNEKRQHTVTVWLIFSPFAAALLSCRKNI